MIPAGDARYAWTEATTVEKKEDILLILLDTAVMALKKARRGIEDRNPKIKGENISRAVSILAELDCALDHDTGKDLTANISGLYHFIMDRLTIANIKDDLEALSEAEQVLDALHEMFKEAVQTYKNEGGLTQIICRNN